MCQSIAQGGKRCASRKAADRARMSLMMQGQPVPPVGPSTHPAGNVPAGRLPTSPPSVGDPAGGSASVTWPTAVRVPEAQTPLITGVWGTGRPVTVRVHHDLVDDRGHINEHHVGTGSMRVTEHAYDVSTAAGHGVLVVTDDVTGERYGWRAALNANGEWVIGTPVGIGKPLPVVPRIAGMSSRD